MFKRRRKEQAMSRNRPSLDRDAAFNAWATWREASDRVQSAWEEVRRARRGTRAGAYAMYRQALLREEHAARDLGLSVGVRPADMELSRLAA
jgi:hypothetical protein